MNDLLQASAGRPSSEQAKYAYHYTARLGLGLVPIPAGLKKPLTKEWQTNPVTDPEQARRIWQGGQNMGALLEASGIVTIDIDNADLLAAAAATLSFDLLGLIEAAPLKIKGKNGAKPVYRYPEGETLAYHKLNWPHPTEKIANGKARQVTVIEFRTGPGRQDVLPPSIHPDTGKPYEWVGCPPRCREDIPEMPAELVAFWRELDTHMATMRAACPWSAPEPTALPASPRAYQTPRQGESVIDAYCQRYTAEEELSDEGYIRKTATRWLSPHSGTGDAGVEIYTDEHGRQRAVTWHESDIWADKKGHDAFDLFCLFKHGGNTKGAVKAAAEMLGMTRINAGPTESLPVPSPSKEDAQQLWAEHSSDVLNAAGEYLTARQMHHHAREATVNLLAYTYQAASEGQLIASGSAFILDVGGLQSFAALVGGKAESLRARMDTLSDLGMVGDFSRATPGDPKSGWLIKLPADPRSLPFLGHTPSPFEPPLRPQTTNVRRGEKFTVPASNTREAKAARTVNSGKAINPLRALLRMVLQLSKHPGHLVEWHSERLSLRLNTARKQLAQLAALGYLTAEGKLTCTYQQFFEDMRAWNAERASRRLVKVFDRQRAFAKHTLTLARLGVEEARQKVGRMKRLVERCATGITRLLDGEAPHTVIGRAA